MRSAPNSLSKNKRIGEVYPTLGSSLRNNHAQAATEVGTDSAISVNVSNSSKRGKVSHVQLKPYPLLSCCFLFLEPCSRKKQKIAGPWVSSKYKIA